MKILHVITGLSRGGAENALYKLLVNSDRARFEHSVISLMRGGPYAEKIEILGVPVREIGLQRGMPGPLGYRRLRKCVAEEAPEVLHGWMYHGALAALASRSGCPVITGIRHSLHDLDHDKQMTRFIIAILARLSRRSARVLYCSKAARTQHEAVGYPKEKGVVIPNGFDAEMFQPNAGLRASARASLGISSNSIVFGSVGRFHAVKDHENLLHAFHHVTRERSDCHLVMIGTGVDEGNLKLTSIVDALQMRDRVLLLGERDDIPTMMNAFDVLVNSSRGEAFPNVLGEAMACAVPCVATDVGDSRELVGGTGEIVPPRDPRALGVAMSLMAGLDTSQRAALGARARTRVIEMFGIAQFVARHEKLYEEVLREADRSGHRR